MSAPAVIAARRDLWPLVLGALFLCAFGLRWPHPEPGWFHVDERVFLLNPLKFWGGDFNPRFFVYPTLHIYLVSALYYGYYLLCGSAPIDQFVAYHYFVDGSALIELCRHFNSLLSAATAVVVALVGRRLYGAAAGALAGLFFAALPLSVRFAHLATTDSPAVFWIACSLLFAVRIPARGRLRDCVLAGICVGLAGATKYPAALAGVPVALACLLFRPAIRQRGLWAAGVAAAATFALVSPYVLLDATRAWADLALMGKIHLASKEATADIPSWRYYLQDGLRHGIGIAGLAGLLAGLGWRPLARRREEWVVAALFAVFFALLLMAESAFMRYALPLAPAVALLWVRPLAPLRGRGAAYALALLLVAEPLYASWQTRALLAGDDTREQVERRLLQEAPQGAWLVHLPKFIGNIAVLDADKVYAHERRFLLSYDSRDLMRAYAGLSRRGDLPPLFIAPQPAALRLGAAGTGDSAYVLWYRHPVIPEVSGASAQALIERCEWVGDYRGGGGGAVYEAVDWYFAPIGGFTGVERTGPDIRLGRVPLRDKAHALDAARFFGMLHDILLGEDKVRVGDWQGGGDLYEGVRRTSLPLHRVLSPDYYFKYLLNYGIAHYGLGDLQSAVAKWSLALQLKDDSPMLHKHLGTAYARQGQSNWARQHLERAVALDGADADAHYSLGKLLYEQGELAAAAGVLRRALQLDPRDQRAAGARRLMEQDF